jgi:hypothetical protein
MFTAIYPHGISARHRIREDCIEAYEICNRPAVKVEAIPLTSKVRRDIDFGFSPTSPTTKWQMHICICLSM